MKRFLWLDVYSKRWQTLKDFQTLREVQKEAFTGIPELQIKMSQGQEVQLDKWDVLLKVHPDQYEVDVLEVHLVQSDFGPKVQPGHWENGGQKAHPGHWEAAGPEVHPHLRGFGAQEVHPDLWEVDVQEVLDGPGVLEGREVLDDRGVLTMSVVAQEVRLQYVVDQSLLNVSQVTLFLRFALL